TPPSSHWISAVGSSASSHHQAAPSSTPSPAQAPPSKPPSSKASNASASKEKPTTYPSSRHASQSPSRPSSTWEASHDRRLLAVLPVPRLPHMHPPGRHRTTTKGGVVARDHARIRLDIWADDDFGSLTSSAQWLYLHLLSSPTLSFAGVADWRPARIAGRTAELTADDVEFF